MSCFDVNQPVSGALQIAFIVLAALLAPAVELPRVLGTRPRPVLRVFACTGCLVAFASMFWAIDEGATDADLWRWVVAPLCLTVFSVYAELWRSRLRPRPLAIALRRRQRRARRRPYAPTP